jgi:hypothetical protein
LAEKGKEKPKAQKKTVSTDEAMKKSKYPAPPKLRGLD